jgi:hypothetical protein
MRILSMYFFIQIPSSRYWWNSLVYKLECFFPSFLEFQWTDGDPGAFSFPKTGLLLHIFNLVFTATLISRVVNYGGSYQRLHPIKQVILNSIQGIIISFSPGIVLYSTIMIFQNSYGTQPPPPLFSPSENVYSSQVLHFIRAHFGCDISGMLDGLVGIDMDQLGSTKLKQFLIRNLMGSLSCSVGIAASFGRSWTFGFVVLCFCSIQKRLLAHVLHQVDFLSPF